MTHTDELAKLIDQKHSCLGQLRELGQRQQALIESGDMSQLLRLLASKQHFLATLQGIERDLAPYRDEDPEARVWRSAEARAACAATSDLCRELLNEIVHLEKTNEALMAQQRHEVANRLHQVHAQARASGAYRSHTQGRVPPRDGSPQPPKPPSPAFEGVRVGGAPATSLDLSSDIR